mmetsp:Transcript_33187/g.93983  ORF Transcript_33187/g.93983 Transcript_33187/m.93983 type:complete len:231 (-) Transcript_33187:3203-3895(-)
MRQDPPPPCPLPLPAAPSATRRRQRPRRRGLPRDLWHTQRPCWPPHLCPRRIPRRPAGRHRTSLLLRRHSPHRQGLPVAKAAVRPALRRRPPLQQRLPRPSLRGAAAEPSLPRRQPLPSRRRKGCWGPRGRAEASPLPGRRQMPAARPLCMVGSSAGRRCLCCLRRRWRGALCLTRAGGTAWTPTSTTCWVPAAVLPLPLPPPQAQGCSPPGLPSSSRQRRPRCRPRWRS